MERIEDEAGNKWHSEDQRRADLNAGVKGAHVCVPFQCEVCWVRNIAQRDPTPLDTTTYYCIRRANLDAMAGSSRRTISSHLGRNKTIIRNAEAANKPPSLYARGPNPLSDSGGMNQALDVLLHTITAKGRNGPHIQFDTARTVRATLTKSYQSSPRGLSEGSSFARGTARVRPTSCPTQTDWFSDFLRGMEYRMGHQSKANRATRIGAIVKAVSYIREDAEACEIEAEANELWKIGAYVTVVTAASLRGNEGFFMDLEGLLRHIGKGKNGSLPAEGITKSTLRSEDTCEALPHVVVCLLGKFKGRTGFDYHMINIASSTTSGLEPRWWIEKLLEVCAAEGRTQGPAFATPQGRLAASMDYDVTFKTYLKKVQVSDPELILPEEDVNQFFSIFRTPRKTAVTRAKRAGIGEPLLSEMNRWSREEGSKNKRVRNTMCAHYSEAVLMMPTTWMYSYAL